MTVMDGKSVLITGGTGSFGKAFVAHVLRNTRARRVIVFSRDELKQSEMARCYPGEERIRFFIGNVRDADRLRRAFVDVDIVIHAAALKQIPIAEYNPLEAVRTNIHGAENIIDAAVERGVERVIALSTDKASSPANLYGATKLVSDKLFVAGNAYVGAGRTRMSVIRYGNVLGSRGSVVPFFQQLAREGATRVPITDLAMTRFWISLGKGLQFVCDNLERMHGGEIFVPKLPSMKIVDVARALVPNAEIEVTGIRPGEKLHEEMISDTAARHTLDMGDHYVIQPEMEWWKGPPLQGGKTLPEGFSYRSDINESWLSVDGLRDLVGSPLS